MDGVVHSVKYYTEIKKDDDRSGLLDSILGILMTSKRTYSVEWCQKNPRPNGLRHK